MTSTFSNAQQELVSGKFNNITLPDFIEQVEQQTDYHFYFDSSLIDSIRITYDAEKVPLKKILDDVFVNTSYQYAVDPLRHIFILKNKQLRTELASHFFDKENVDAELSFEEAEKSVDKKQKPTATFTENRLYEIGSKTSSKKNAALNGFVKHINTGEALAGASLYLDSVFTGVTTDQYGYFVVNVPSGSHVLEITSAGMKDVRRNLLVYSDGQLDIEMQDDIPTLKNVIITSERRSNIRSTQMGIDRLSTSTIKQIPVVFGEADILRVVLTLPGVTSVGEASTGFNVRGGSADQNLVLFDDATIYNPSHLFGFFSAFNTDVIKGVELYKSVVPVKFGGRLSSVLDVSAKDGNDKKITGNGGIGLLTSRFAIEGPLSKEKTSFVLAGRTTYSDWLLKTIPDKEFNNSQASFYDANLHITHKINQNNNIYLTGYLSNDKFRFSTDTTYGYSNKSLVLKWKHTFNNKFYTTLSTGIDHYNYEVTSSKNPANSYKLTYDIDQKNFKADFNYRIDNKRSLNFGLNAIYYQLRPGSFLPNHVNSLVKPDVLSKEQGIESAAYLGYAYNITPALSVNAGIRYSLYNYVGPHDTYQYLEGYPKDVTTITDTIHYAAGKFIKTYHGPEYRVSLRYAITGDASIKIGYNTLRQYIHQFSNTIAISPTDIWKLSDANIKPQFGQQVSIGFYKNFKNDRFETSVEAYYRLLKNIPDYKSGASILLNRHLETDLINSRGKAYGVEFLIKKPGGKLNGWLSYTWSRTLLQQNDELAGEIINKGKYYPASYDKPHVANLISNYRFSHRIMMSLNVVYSTGRPITLPIAVFNSNGAQRVLYSDRNQYRIPDYFRTDVSFTLDGNHRINQKIHNSWSVGFYNVTARQNAYSVYFTQQNGIVKGYQLSIFGTIIPYISYNFKF